MAQPPSIIQMPPYDVVVDVLKREKPQAQITDFRVLLAYSEVDERRDGDIEGGPEVKVKQSHTLGPRSVSVRTEVQTTIPVDADADAPATKPGVARFRFATGITYTFDGDASDEARIYFGKLQGVHQTWPYCRTHLHASSSLLGFSPAPIAPLLPQREAARLAGFETAEKDSENTGS